MLKKKISIITIILIIVLAICSAYCMPTIIATETTENTNTGTWNSINFTDLTNNVDTSNERIIDKLIDSAVFDGKLYIASAIATQSRNTSEISNKIYIQSYNGESWSNVGSEIVLETSKRSINKISFCNRLDNLYIFYSAQGLLGVSKLNQANNQWEEIDLITDTCGTFGIATEDDTTYLTVINIDQSIARIYNFDGNHLIEEGTYFENNGNIDEPKVALLDGELYIGLVEVGKIKISIYRYINGRAEKIDSDINAYSYTMSVVAEDTGNKLYIAATSTDDKDMTIYTYDGRKWATIATGFEFEKHYPEMVVKSGEVYIVALMIDDKLQTYTYSKSKGEFVKQGEDVDNSAVKAQAITYNGHIYTIYEDSDTLEIRVKRKEYTSDYFRGDVNQDNRVSTADVILGVRGLSGIAQLTKEQRAIGDVTGDGDFTVADIIRITKYLAKHIDVL